MTTHNKQTELDDLNQFEVRKVPVVIVMVGFLTLMIVFIVIALMAIFENDMIQLSRRSVLTHSIGYGIGCAMISFGAWVILKKGKF